METKNEIIIGEYLVVEDIKGSFYVRKTYSNTKGALREIADKIDFEYHGYTKCTDPSCPGVCVTLDKGSEYGKHDFYSGCNVKCKKCGDLGNPDAKHHFNIVPDKTDEKYHVHQCDKVHRNLLLRR